MSEGRVGTPVWDFWTKLLFLLFAVLLAGGFFVLKGQSEIKETQAQGRQRTYESRSLSCRVLIALGEDLPQGDPCRDKEVTAYYDPDELIAKRAARSDATTKALGEVSQIKSLTCRLINIMQRQDPACGPTSSESP